jgi:hypothetical protein
MTKNVILYAILIIGFIMFADSVFGMEYSEHYFGLSTTVKKYDMVSLFQGDPVLDGVSLDFSATYGPPFMNPFRFRAGFGFYDFKGLYLSAGMEIPLFERLNDYHAKKWGIYIIPEFEVSLSRWDAAIRFEVLIPINVLGGIQLGIGINRHINIIFSVSYSTGLYPLVK